MVWQVPVTSFSITLQSNSRLQKIAENACLDDLRIYLFLLESWNLVKLKKKLKLCKNANVMNLI